MRVRLLTGRATIERGDPPGAVVDLDPAEAIRLIERQAAEPVRGTPDPETAVRRRRRAEKATR